MTLIQTTKRKRKFKKNVTFCALNGCVFIYRLGTGEIYMYQWKMFTNDKNVHAVIRLGVWLGECLSKMRQADTHLPVSPLSLDRLHHWKQSTQHTWAHDQAASVLRHGIVALQSQTEVWMDSGTSFSNKKLAVVIMIIYYVHNVINYLPKTTCAKCRAMMLKKKSTILTSISFFFFFAYSPRKSI